MVLGNLKLAIIFSLGFLVPPFTTTARIFNRVNSVNFPVADGIYGGS
jgi:hypothetical protein